MAGTLQALRAIALAAFLAGPLAACAGGAVVPLAMTGSEVYGYSATKKTNIDHLISAVAGEDCSIRNLGLGRQYCMAPAQPSAEPAAYCYRTIAEVTCYREARPADAGRQIQAP
ncbi:MAG: hypothetical protein FJX51_10435 [Alphaproteobacteria bacterium]|nr:hypothetical protein [Alphaproteobacteria bacterium]